MTTTESSFVNIQEHFLTQYSSARKTTGNATKVLSDSFNDYKPYIIPAVRKPGQRLGRASGGLAQLASCDLDLKYDRVESKSYRPATNGLNSQNAEQIFNEISKSCTLRRVETDSKLIYSV